MKNSITPPPIDSKSIFQKCRLIMNKGLKSALWATGLFVLISSAYKIHYWGDHSFNVHLHGAAFYSAPHAHATERAILLDKSSKFQPLFSYKKLPALEKKIEDSIFVPLMRF